MKQENSQFMDQIDKFETDSLKISKDIANSNEIKNSLSFKSCE